ncbi:ArsC/Spx/MgsR family protein [Acidimangrovimonas pyrenivorans]|uniref:ArsC/Spx/MgsR family protein n=1 Tax=Acidimangrovimonas pyrenivorans TaxID=2030798 RepID=A0ABV7ABV2_9RHOB
MILYGIPSCDTCRKARKALAAAGHDVTFRDVRAQPLSPAELAALLAEFGDKLVNRASTSWRGLSEAERARPAADLLAEHPALMKRPVVEDGGRRTLGWAAAAQAAWGL